MYSKICSEELDYISYCMKFIFYFNTTSFVALGMYLCYRMIK
ncbi:hypothetical protein J2780_000483 [Chryseobacterium camelliae]|nr:hypothetical protein [Chryseobacterium camelliae]